MADFRIMLAYPLGSMDTAPAGVGTCALYLSPFSSLSAKEQETRLRSVAKANDWLVDEESVVSDARGFDRQGRLPPGLALLIAGAMQDNRAFDYILTDDVASLASDTELAFYIVRCFAKMRVAVCWPLSQPNEELYSERNELLVCF